MMEKLDALLVRIRTSNVFTKHAVEDEQMGLLYIATHCNNNGFRSAVLDEQNYSLDLLDTTLEKSGAKIVGFFCDHENINSVISSVNYLKKNGKEFFCVAGGPQVTACPWDRRIFERSPQLDVVVKGEGEEAFLDILKSVLHKQKKLSDILGIVYQENGEINETPPRPLEKGLDNFPIPDRNLNYYGKNPDGSENMVTARGCPHHCAFCFEGQSYSVRLRSPESVLEEIEYLLKERDMTYVAILDDVFTVKIKRLKEICEGFKRLQEKYHPFSWFCEGRVEVISRHPEIAKEMYDAGLIRLQIGVESGSQKVLDAYNKGISLSQITDAVDICYAADILSTVGNFIIGGAHEDQETVYKSIDFACDLMKRAPGCYDFNTTILTPYPGTEIYKHPEKYGMTILDEDCVTGFGDNYAFAETKALSKWEILDARQSFMEVVENQAKALIPEVDEERKLRHFKAYYHFGIQTIWYQIIASQLNLYNYYGLQVSRDKKSYGTLSAQEVLTHKPLRTINIGSSISDQLVLPFHERPLKFSYLGGKIFELCTGKLTVGQILETIGQSLPPDHPPLKEYVFETLEFLDREKLIVFSDL